jgi:hypothetical protein
MNRYAAALLAVSAAAFGGQALAESPNAVPEQAFVASKSRADVQAELAQYKQAGVNPWSTSYNPLRDFKSVASRDQVTAAYVAARDEVAAFGREDSGAEYLAQRGQAPSSATTLAGQPAANAR